jgi:hypothetical protein
MYFKLRIFSKLEEKKEPIYIAHDFPTWYQRKSRTQLLQNIHTAETLRIFLFITCS